MSNKNIEDPQSKEPQRPQHIDRLTQTEHPISTYMWTKVPWKEESQPPPHVHATTQG